jgi:glycosyltransferase involved in cell wall biosynthesis
MAPRVAVVIPFHNADEFFGECLASVLAQTRTADEIVVVDDASDPARRRTLEHLPAGVRLIRLEKNSGQGVARNAGVQATGAELIAFLDADDVFASGKLQVTERFLSDHPEADACHTGTVVFQADGSERIFGDKPDPLGFPDLLIRGHALPSATVIRRDALLALGGFSADRSLYEDWDLTIRMVQAGRCIRFVPEPLSRIRRFGHGNVSSYWWTNLRLHLGTIRANRALYRRHLGPGGTREVIALCVRSAGERRGGLFGRAIFGAGWVLGHRFV